MGDAWRLGEVRKAAGINQAGHDEAAKKGFTAGAFEESGEEGAAAVEEFYPATDKVADQDAGTYPVGGSLHRKLDLKLQNNSV